MSMRIKLARAALVAALIATVTTTPVLAAKTPTSGLSRGKVNLYVFNDKYNPGYCGYRINGSNLAQQEIYAGSSYNLQENNYRSIGTVHSDGYVETFPGPRLEIERFNKVYRLTVYAGGYLPIYDIYGQPATISISNSCAY